MAFAFEKLVVYQKAVDFADNICQTTSKFPNGFYFLRDQLNRASLSVAANIAEGNGRFTKNDRKHFFGIARGSVQECVPLRAHLFSRIGIKDIFFCAEICFFCGTLSQPQLKVLDSFSYNRFF